MLALSAMTAALTTFGAQTAVPPAGAEAGPPPALHTFTFDNGLKVFLRPIDHCESIALVVVYSFGEGADPEGQSGLGHLIEHLYCMSAAGDIPARTAEAWFSAYAPPLGCNAQTGEDYTVFATVFRPDRLEAEIREAALRMSDLRIEQADLEREWPRMELELSNMHGGFARLAAMNRARELVRPSPTGARKGGVIEQIRTIPLEHIKARWAKYYRPNNARLAIAGGFEPAHARRLIERWFARLPSGEPAPAARPRPPGMSGVTDIITAQQHFGTPESDAMVCKAFRAPLPGEEHYIALQSVVGGLYRKMMAQRSVSGPGAPQVFYMAVDDPSFIAVMAPVPSQVAPEKASAELDRWIASAVTVKDEAAAVDTATPRGAFGPLMGLPGTPELALAQNPYGLAFGLARADQLGIDAEELVAGLDKLTGQDLRRCAEAVFAPECGVTVIARLPAESDPEAPAAETATPSEDE